MENLRDAFHRLTDSLRAGAITVQEASEALASMGYEATHVLEGPRVTVQFELRSNEEVSAGDLMTISPDGTARRANPWEVPIGVALEDGRMRIGGGGGVRVQVAGRPGMPTVQDATQRLYERAGPAAILLERDQSIHASVAYQVGSIALPDGAGARRLAAHHRFQYTAEKFPQEARAKAWVLLEKFMAPDQHFAFMEGSNIELQNREKTYRVLLNRSGNFSILQGDLGAGIVATAGTIHSDKYPLGDEIAAFLDWFNHRTEDLIMQWNCGIYGIKREDELHRR